MPILAATPTPDPRAEAIFAAGCLLVGLAFAAVLRLLRPSRVTSPDRVPPGVSVWPLVAVLGAGLFFWYVIPVTYFTVKQARLMAKEGPEARIDPTRLTAGDLAFIATVPPVGGLLALLMGDTTLRRRFGIDLGSGRGRLGKGLLLGLLGGLCVVPVVDGSMILVEWAYRATGYEHPKEHDLLRALGESTSPATEIALIIGAAVMAPLFEELLFRGHLQTVLRSGLARMVRPWRPVVEQGLEAAPVGAGQTLAAEGIGSVSPQAAGTAPEVLPYRSPEPETLPTVPPLWASWMAILATSALFAVVHPMWTWPAIFLLAVCLGYAYERTGNLWVPIVIHAAFNATSTVIYLYGGGAN
jgi:membrane protease YdiL (CAAX protease family)